MEYIVSVYRDRGTKHVSSVTFKSLTFAAKQFSEAAGLVMLMGEHNTAVLLGKVTGPNSSVTLAAKSTDGRSVEFYPAYYELLFRRDAATMQQPGSIQADVHL